MEPLALLHTAVAYESVADASVVDELAEVAEVAERMVSLGLPPSHGSRLATPIALLLVGLTVVPQVTMIGTAQAADDALPLPIVLSRGDRSRQVAAVQVALGIPADGLFGAQTQAAVLTFQQQQGLTADGLVGPATLNALGLVFETEPAANAVSTSNGENGTGISRPNQPTDPSLRVARVTTAGRPLLVRAQPTTTAPSIASLPNGTIVQYSSLINMEDGLWVLLAPLDGWIRSDYVEFIPDQPPDPNAGTPAGRTAIAQTTQTVANTPASGATPASSTGIVNSSGNARVRTAGNPLTVRTQPTTTSAALTYLPHGTAIRYSQRVDQPDGRWLYLEAIAGWVRDDYVIYLDPKPGNATATGASPQPASSQAASPSPARSPSTAVPQVIPLTPAPSPSPTASPKVGTTTNVFLPTSRQPMVAQGGEAVGDRQATSPTAV